MDREISRSDGNAWLVYSGMLSLRESEVNVDEAADMVRNRKETIRAVVNPTKTQNAQRS